MSPQRPRPTAAFAAYTGITIALIAALVGIALGRASYALGLHDDAQMFLEFVIGTCAGLTYGIFLGHLAARR